MHKTNHRWAWVTFTLIWLAILTIFSFSPHHTSMLMTYAVLAALASLMSPGLVRNDAGRSAGLVLTYLAATSFGPTAGALVGTECMLGQFAEGGNGSHRARFISRLVAGTASGFACGLAYAWLTTQVDASTLPYHAGAMAVSALVCYAVFMLAGMLTTRSLEGNSLRERYAASAPELAELVSGLALAATAMVLHRLLSSQFLLLMVPIAYLVKQSLDMLVPGSAAASNSPLHCLGGLYLPTVHSLVTAIDSKDRFTRSHTANVERIAVALAHEMGLSAHEVEGVRLAALLHDIGKLGIPEHILLKPGKYDANELSTVQGHAAIGHRILQAVQFPWPIGNMVRSHHERWDGTGYPDQLRHDQIPLGARILAVADVYDAMTSKRSYRSNLTHEQAMRNIQNASGALFDPEVVDAFLHVSENGGLDYVDPECIRKATRDCVPQSDGGNGSSRAHSDSDGLSAGSNEFLAVFEIAQTASMSLNLDEVLPLLAAKIRAMISCSTCVIVLRDGTSDRLCVRKAAGDNVACFEGGRTHLGYGLTGLVAETGQGILAPYDKYDIVIEQPAREWIELHSAMVVPITHMDRVLGTINLYDAAQDAFSQEDFRMLSSMVPQVGIAIQNALLFEQTKESALTDALTGLHNARYLQAHLEQELNRAKRSLQEVSVLGMDLDHFKPINDTFGHHQGDIVLQEIGQVFLSQVRDYDVVCRSAGDEFAIILPNTGKAEANETAERIRAAVAHYTPKLPHNRPMRLGVSVGVATYPEDGRDVETLMSAADDAMYVDKRARKASRAA